MATRTPRGFGQYSGVARALERIGERWALLIVRDLLAGARRYGDLKANLPRIPTNILSDRLKELQAADVIRRVPTVRGGYELTALGRRLEPVVLALERWGWSVLGDPADDEVVTRDALAASLRAAFLPDAAAGQPPTRYELHVADASVAAVVAGGRLVVEYIGPGALAQPHREADADPPAASVVELLLTPAGFRDLVAGDLGRAARGLVAGDARSLECFSEVFHIPLGEPSPSEVPFSALGN